MLTYMGAMMQAMEIMNVKIYKEVRNNVNRSVNCEAANLDKTIAAAQKQADDINYIFEKKRRRVSARRAFAGGKNPPYRT